MSNQKQWEQMHEENRFRPKYPEDDVVRWLFKNVIRGGESRVLDDGCGAGRHIKLLAENGYIPYGIDFSKSGVDYTKQVLIDAGYEKYVDNIQQGTCDSLPYEDGLFDGVISFGVLYYLEEKDISQSVNEIYRVLRGGGKAIVVVRSTEDYRYSLSDGTDTNAVISVNNNRLSAHAENGMSEHFFTKNEVEILFKRFKEVSIERIIRTHDNETICDNDFIISVIK